jgi:hypothetical protein
VTLLRHQPNVKMWHTLDGGERKWPNGPSPINNGFRWLTISQMEENNRKAIVAAGAAAT